MRPKRSFETSLLSSERKKRKTLRDGTIEDGSLLVETLSKHHLLLCSGGKPHQLGVDQASFIKSFSKDISTHLEYPNNIDNMMSTLFKYLDDAAFLNKSLNATHTSPDCANARNELQDSLLRILLCVPELQTKLMLKLLEILAETAITDEITSQNNAQVEESSIPRLLLSCVRFLPAVKEDDSAVVAAKIMEILPACPLSVQREIILCVPEILPDSQHETIAGALKDILDETRHLTCTILDSLACMVISRPVVRELVDIVLKRLYRVSLRDLPSVVDFVLSTSQNESDILELIRELRRCLCLTPTPSSQQNAPSQLKQNETKEDIQCIILDNIHLKCLMNRALCDAWLKCVDTSVEPDDQKGLDVILLTGISDIHGKRRNVELIFKNKIRHGLFTEELLRKTLVDYKSVVRKYFTNFMSIAGSLLSSHEVIISNFGIAMYTETFAGFGPGEAYYQQEIVGELTSKVGTGAGGLITDGALSSLQRLSKRNNKDLAVFSPMITALMELTESMSLAQFRQLMQILCNLAWQEDNHESASNLSTEINIMMKKQLCSRSLILQKMGVIGVVNAVKAKGRHMAQGTGQSDIASTSSKSDEGIQDLINLAIDQTLKCPEASGLFMDELAAPDSVTSLPAVIVKSCSEKFGDNFEAEFIEDIQGSPNTDGQDILPTEVFFKLENIDSQDLESEAEIVVPISKWVMESKRNPLDKKTNMHRFIPNFRLVAAFNNNASDLDALLGCGVILFPESYIDGEKTLTRRELDSVCDSVFLCLNWFREIVNFFSAYNDDEIRKLVLLRLKNILYLQEKLQLLLPQHDQYRPPPVLFCEDTSSWSPPTAIDKSKSKSKKGVGKAKGKKSKPVKPNETIMNATVHLTTQEAKDAPIASSTHIDQSQMTQGKTATATCKLADLQAYRPFFRELDLNYLNVFDYNVVNTEREPSYAEEKLDPHLRPQELFFLLKDLSAKIEYRFQSSGRRKGFPGQGTPITSYGHTNLMSQDVNSIAIKIAKFLPKLFANLDVIKEYFQSLIHLNDGVVDSANMFDTTNQLCSKCLKLGFDIAANLISWSGFQSSTMSSVLYDCLKSLVERVETVISDARRPLSLSGLAEKVIKYLSTFTEIISSCEVAGSHASLLDKVFRIETSSQMNKQTVHKIVSEYSKRNWQTSLGREKGTTFNQQVEKFFILSLEYAENCLQEMHNMFNITVQDVVENRAKDYYNETFQTISRNTIHIVYNVCLQKLVDILRKRASGSARDKIEQLELWTVSTSLVQKAVLPLKTWRNHSILKAVLKLSKPFLDYFLRHALPLLGSVFRKHYNDCINILKTLQNSTRYLHVICTSTKLNSDIALSNHVPALKKSLESVVFGVQAMLSANNFRDAFWMGNLKNRDLEGEEILSQVAEEEDEEEENEEENDEDSEDGEPEDMGHGSSEPDDEEYGGNGSAYTTH